MFNAELTKQKLKIKKYYSKTIKCSSMLHFSDSSVSVAHACPRCAVSTSLQLFNSLG